jgi:16S rRNA (cytosine967-C5)-methyltransferase
MVLRLALAQKIGLGTPDHALVATALPLVDDGPRRLVHGVLGSLLRRGLPPMDAPRLPPAVEERWRIAWGEPVVAAARRQIASRPALDLTFANEPDAIAFGGISLAPKHVRVESQSVSGLPGFAEGKWWVQDLAASLPARLVPADAQDLLDVAAAPGGKTMQLAAAGHDVIAVDSSRSRLARLKENLQRTHLKAELVEADALAWEPKRQFDAILLDAPCSGTGTLRRHPDIAWLKDEEDVGRLSLTQDRLLVRAADLLKPGGTLLYAVCSLQEDEGLARLEALLARDSRLQRVPIQPAEVPGFVDAVTPAGDVRTLPSMWAERGGMDGFYIARLLRR